MAINQRHDLCVFARNAFWGIEVFIALFWLFHPPASTGYVMFLAVGLTAQVIGFKWFYQQCSKVFLITQGILCFILVGCLFKIAVYPERPLWPTVILPWLIVGAVAVNVFWKHVFEFGKNAYAVLMNDKNVPSLSVLITSFFPFWIVAFLYVPDSKAVVARMFIGEHFHHMESFLVGPAYAFSVGNILHIDTISRYGFGLPIIFSYLTKPLGGVGYESVFIVLMYCCIVYYVLWFFLLKKMFNNVFVAMACLLWGLKVQMFNQGGYPFMLTYPSGTPIRYWFDVVLFFLIFYHLSTQRLIFVWLAALCCGVAAFYAYMAIHVMVPHFREKLIRSQRDWVVLGAILLTMPITTVGLFWLFLGPHLFGSEFAANLTDFGQRYLNCFATEPMFQRVQEKQFFFSMIGFAYPLIYCGTIVFAMTMMFLRKLDYKHLIVVVLAVYGLCAYQYHVVVSSSYYTHGLPCIFILFYWFNLWLRTVAERYRKHIFMWLMGVIIFSVVTNHMVIMYPNIFNMSRNPLVDRLVLNMNGPIKYFNQCFIQYPDAFKLPRNSLGTTFEDWRTEDNFSSDEEVKAYYIKEFNFPEDVAMIKALTQPNEKVAVLSSFEIKFLMDAKRKPLFYFFPLVNSRPLWMRIFVTTHMYSTGHLQKTIDQLKTNHSDYVFMEKIFLTKQIPQAYLYDSQDFVNILEYIDLNYQPVAFGRFLVAMKRKGAAS